jgi:hypothetical protein
MRWSEKKNYPQMTQMSQMEQWEKGYLRHLRHLRIVFPVLRTRGSKLSVFPGTIFLGNLTAIWSKLRPQWMRGMGPAPKWRAGVQAAHAAGANHPRRERRADVRC